MSEQEIFLAAVEIPDLAARQAYLDQACTGNPALRQQVDALLKVHATAGDFLKTPAIQQFSPRPATSDGNDDRDSSVPAEFERRTALCRMLYEVLRMATMKSRLDSCCPRISRTRSGGWGIMKS